MTNYLYGTADIMKKLGVSRARVSQLRKDLTENEDYIYLSPKVILYSVEAYNKLHNRQMHNLKFNPIK